jgi:hypothetical protein
VTLLNSFSFGDGWSSCRNKQVRRSVTNDGLLSATCLSLCWAINWIILFLLREIKTYSPAFTWFIYLTSRRNWPLMFLQNLSKKCYILQLRESTTQWSYKQPTAIPIQTSIGSGIPRGIRFSQFLDNRCMNVVRLPAFSTGRLNPQEILLVLISVGGWIEPRVTLRPKGLIIPSGIEPAIFRYVFKYLDQMRHHVPSKVNLQCAFSLRLTNKYTQYLSTLYLCYPYRCVTSKFLLSVYCRTQHVNYC